LAAGLAVARLPGRLYGREPRPRALIHVYPYPFIDVGALAYQRVLGNVGLLLAGFLALSLVYVAVDRAMRPRP
jgi:hypothetical protein